MADALKLFILAGEASGDRIGADLIKRLRARGPVSLQGVGGAEMTAEGLWSLFPMSDLSVMGISDVLARLPLLLWRVEQTARAIRTASPDIVVLIDSQEFVRLVAQRLRRKGFTRPILLYVAPTVWARAPERAKKLVPLFDEILTVLPFEPKAISDLGGPPASYVGHPATADITPPRHLSEGRVALLPGSRAGELRRHLPLMREVAIGLFAHPKVTGVFIPTLSSLADRLKTETAIWPVDTEIVVGAEARAARYRETILAISVAGTATLELALANIPMVVTYVMDRHQARIFNKIGGGHVALPNIIAGEDLVSEIIAGSPQPQAVISAALDLVDNKKARDDQIAGFQSIAKRMVSGDPDSPRQDPADRVLAHVKPGQRAEIGE